ncbi:MAG: hypothetical protein A2509_03415 [Candidatus Edwardsbacteria bacterium RIFOXYD12_FULL_50_11]|uniref:Cytosolic protein n=1 Tax=Candidatus Edwardsbacteria bacterium GWF2_54_11 TaxID=1817851 RepID=A0A1F5R7Z0_9BACT|nr:MAG: hypothetical protein A2502_03330 [Candidatus Edwardsbacteria bacterium RifOxyC12_full_54_24]OGF07745.1 MAG: hypothetical protein A2273_04580 [Candidatus Edwardsbacteria bacterium RifOxyA12_full_54_48]OGF09995.1 MAG: hypothetical protein A3K15_10990 [Candidatus Edwardsbacteria bacterium GWE2_54_12]OGF10536.1 MAG: hypothetical protein A2024_09320 [Candidatus Edwardsbacteria bacterium GWF2_54_11]OGF14905.1 MAG: hypothetical protein A2509_03415 [Candidatus Edwardsbacteria bacterium RIFOXYD1
MECNKINNLKSCNCSYQPCSRKGVCCECIAYHRAMDQLPACYFSEKIERSCDRSIEAFIKDQKR